MRKENSICRVDHLQVTSLIIEHVPEPRPPSVRILLHTMMIIIMGTWRERECARARVCVCVCVCVWSCVCVCVNV